MTLDWHICSRARLSRDPRFDGKFFIGVLGSGVYCRPICPAPTAKEKNVRYFPTAAAAAEAGFRPCLRCRPECSPGTPAWSGTSTTVSRALRLIGESGLEDGGVEMLAQKLGVGSRHLRRLFLRHLGATPLAVAQTRRLHFAKKLIDETTLPMNHVALAAGFGSVRRFNAHIRNVYHRTPTQIRRLARQTLGRPDLAHQTASENLYSFRLRFRPPYHWPAILDFLAPRCTPGVEAVLDGVYRRSIAFQSHCGYFEVSLDAAHLALDVRLHFANPRSLFFIIERIRTMFDLSADWHAIESTLGADPMLTEIIHAQPGLRVPGSWDGFELAVRAILGQQTTVKGATALAGKIARAFGEPFDGPAGLTHLFPSPEILAKTDLSSMGLPATRAAAIRSLARAVCDHTITFEGIIDANAFLDRLCRIPGIGKWTAQYVAMRALAEPDAFPSGDRGLSRVLGLDAPNEIERRAESWRPWRSYAVLYLWRLESESWPRKPTPRQLETAAREHGPQGASAVL